MYRLTAPNLFIFIPVIIIGILFATLTPGYINANRILSLISLIIGQIGMSFIPVISLFPKANLLQAIILAISYFLTTFIICFATWGIYNLGLTEDYAFLWKDDIFHVNIASLFVANIIAFINLIFCYKLIYDEEMTKEFHAKGRKFKKVSRNKLSDFKSSILNRPSFEKGKSYTERPRQGVSSSPSKATKKEDLFLDEDFGKPFDFEPEKEAISDKLPEESSGELFTQEIKEGPLQSDFFTDDVNFKSDFIETKNDFNRSSSTGSVEESFQSSINLPTDIKDDLAAIFEQYSSLDAVKKITNEKVEKIQEKKKELFSFPKEEIKINIKDEDIEEATFRQVSESEKIEELKKTFREDIKEENEIKPKPQIQNMQESLIDIPVVQESKIEVVENKIETENKVEVENDFTQEEINLLNESLNAVNSQPKVTGSMFISPAGKVITENVKNKTSLKEGNMVGLFSHYNEEISKTNQGGLSHLLLESEDGTVVMANLENLLLTVITEGKGEDYTGQILRAVTKVEEEI